MLIRSQPFMPGLKLMAALKIALQWWPQQSQQPPQRHLSPQKNPQPQEKTNLNIKICQN